MFGTKYSRLTFWIWSVILIIPFSLFSTFSRATASDSELANSSLIFSGLVFIVILMWINALANRIRDYGSNPWIAVFSLIPLVNIGLALYYGIVKYKNKPIENNTVSNNSNPSLVKAVYNHSKDIASEVKPTINEYKEKHQASETNTDDILSIDENKIDKNIDVVINKIDKVIDDSVKQVKTSKYVAKGFGTLKITFLIAVVLGIVIAIVNFGYEEYKYQQLISSEEYKILKKKCDSGKCTSRERLELMIMEQG